MNRSKASSAARPMMRSLPSSLLVAATLVLLLADWCQKTTTVPTAQALSIRRAHSRHPQDNASLFRLHPTPKRARLPIIRPAAHRGNDNESSEGGSSSSSSRKRNTNSDGGSHGSRNTNRRSDRPGRTDNKKEKVRGWNGWLSRKRQSANQMDGVGNDLVSSQPSSSSFSSPSTPPSSKAKQLNVNVNGSSGSIGSSSIGFGIGNMFRRNGRSNTGKDSDKENSNDSISHSSRMDDVVDNMDPSSVPTYRTLLIFTLSTILIWLSEPLLSLVDMTIVSLTAPSAARSVVQIAALGPATTLFDSTIYMTYFLAIATTNVLGPLLAKQKWKELRKNTSHILGLAVTGGLIVSGIVCGLGRPLLRSMMGSINDPEILNLAYKYCWIRGAVAPINVCAMISQSFCLANLDTVTPFVAVALSSVVNIVGDWLLSPKYGIAGAAFATALAGITSAAVLLRQVAKKTSEWKESQYIEEGRVTASSPMAQLSRIVNGRLELIPTNATASIDDGASGASSEGASSDGAIPISAIPIWPPPDANADGAGGGRSRSKKGIARNGNKKDVFGMGISETDQEDDIAFVSLPDRKSLIELFQLAGPVFFVMMAKIVCFSVLTIQATNFGVLALAAHNILMRVYFFFSCFGDSLGQAAQSFFPPVQDQPRQQNVLFRRLFYIASGMGILNGAIIRGILQHGTKFLTPDTTIRTLLATHFTPVSLGVVIHPIIMLLEGSLYARRDLTFLLVMYGLTTLLHCGIVFSPMLTFAVQHVWRALCIFQILRFTQIGYRALALNRRAKAA